MFTKDHLSLSLIRLQPGEEWLFNNGESLCFIFPKEGAGSYSWGGGTPRLLPGDVFLLKSPPPEQISISAKAEMTFQYFSARFEHLFPLFATGEIGMLHRVIEGLKTIKHYTASNPLAMECHRFLADVPPQFGLDHRGQLVRILAAIFSAEFKQQGPRSRGAIQPDQRVTRLFDELSVAEITESSASDLAKRLSCSKRHFNRLFHDYFGLSFAALRMELRMLRAASLLRDPGVKVILVAEQCGFNHLSLFNSCFKRRFGLSPGQFRKSIDENPSSIGNDPSANSICHLSDIGLCPRAVEFNKARCLLEKPAAAARSSSARLGSTALRTVVQAVRCAGDHRVQPSTPVLKLRIQV